MQFIKNILLTLLIAKFLPSSLCGICELCQCTGADSSIIRCEGKNFDNYTEIFDSLAFSNTEMVKELIVKKYEIKSLSLDAFRGLKNLRSLDLSENSINTVEATVFKDLKNLEALDLSSNRLEVLNGAIFSNIESLLYLNLNGNQIHDLNSTDIGQTSKLTSLYLSRNNLENIDTEFIKSLKNLQILDVSFNRIVSISPETLPQLESLNELRLNNNFLTTVSGDYFPKSLRIINIAGNNLQSLPKNLSQIQELNIANNSITDIDASSAWLKELRYLNLSDNSLTTIPQVSFENLKILDLSMNHFKIMPKELSSTNFPSLETLVIDENPVENLRFEAELNLRKVYIRRLPNLKMIRSDTFAKVKGINDEPIDLIISENPRLSYIEKGAFDDVSINTLDLSKNAFTTISLEIIKPNNVYLIEKDINFQGNPFDCDCQLQWMLNDLVPHLYKVNAQLLENLRCETPIELSGVRMVHFYQWKTQVFCEKKSERLSRMSVAASAENGTKSIRIESSRGMLAIVGAAMGILCILIIAGIIIARKMELRKRRNNRRF